MPSILIVDDHEAIRTGLRMIIESDPGLRVCGEAGDGAAAIRAVRELAPDIALMDIRMPGVDGIEATEWITRNTETRVLILSTFGMDDLIASALFAGASGFLQKSVSGPELNAGLWATSRGQTTLSPEVAGAVVRQFRALGESPRRGTRRVPGLERLTPRERDVLRALGRGRSNAQIAAHLHIEETTVKSHLGAIYSKTGTSSRVGAALLGRELSELPKD